MPLLFLKFLEIMEGNDYFEEMISVLVSSKERLKIIDDFWFYLPHPSLPLNYCLDILFFVKSKNASDIRKFVFIV